MEEGDIVHPLKHIRMVCTRDFVIIFRIYWTITTSFGSVHYSI